MLTGRVFLFFSFFFKGGYVYISLSPSGTISLYTSCTIMYSWLHVVATTSIGTFAATIMDTDSTLDSQNTTRASYPSLEWHQLVNRTTSRS
ncbi:hypothetical protein ACQKWADRAFT_302810 [Trichoderma austrokoningii]